MSFIALPGLQELAFRACLWSSLRVLLAFFRIANLSSRDCIWCIWGILKKRSLGDVHVPVKHFSLFWLSRLILTFRWRLNPVQGHMCLGQNMLAGNGVYNMIVNSQRQSSKNWGKLHSSLKGDPCDVLMVPSWWVAHTRAATRTYIAFACYLCSVWNGCCFWSNGFVFSARAIVSRGRHLTCYAFFSLHPDFVR